MPKVRNGLNSEKIESVPSVQDLQQEVHHSVMHFANFVQTFVMPVLLNVKNFQHTIVVKSVPKLAESVKQNAERLRLKIFLNQQAIGTNYSDSLLKNLFYDEQLLRRYGASNGN